MGQTPIKKENHQRDEEKTIKLEKIFPTLENPNPHLHYYQSYNSYTLGSINSISLSKNAFMQAMAGYMISSRLKKTVILSINLQSADAPVLNVLPNIVNAFRGVRLATKSVDAGAAKILLTEILIPRSSRKSGSADAQNLSV